MKLDMAKVVAQCTTMDAVKSVQVDPETGAIVVRFLSVNTGECLLQSPVEEYLQDPTPSLRSEFAKAAMQGLCANENIGDRPAETIAGYAVVHADALIAALKGE